MYLARTLVAAALLTTAAGRLGAQHAPAGTAGERASSFEGMAELRRELAGVEHLTDAQRAALEKVEGAYRARYRAAGAALLAALDRARADGAPPEPDEMRRLDAAVRAAWLDEIREVRALLRDGAQRARFDANVAALRGEEGR